MIRINLLPFRAARQRENIRKQISIFVLLTICLILGLAWYSIILDKKITNIKNTISSVDKEIAKYKKDAQRVVQIRKKINAYKKKVKTIKALKKRRRITIELLDEMTKLIIPKKMWLTNLSASNNTVSINGIAFDQKTVADFMTKIERSSLFNKNVVLKRLDRGAVGKTIVQNFSLTCTKKIKKK